MEKARKILKLLLQINFLYVCYIFRLDLVYSLQEDLATIGPATIVAAGFLKQLVAAVNQRALQ